MPARVQYQVRVRGKSRSRRQRGLRRLRRARRAHRHSAVGSLGSSGPTRSPRPRPRPRPGTGRRASGPSEAIRAVSGPSLNAEPGEGPAFPWSAANDWPSCCQNGGTDGQSAPDWTSGVLVGSLRTSLGWCGQAWRCCAVGTALGDRGAAAGSPRLRAERFRLRASRLAADWDSPAWGRLVGAGREVAGSLTGLQDVLGEVSEFPVAVLACLAETQERLLVGQPVTGHQDAERGADAAVGVQGGIQLESGSAVRRGRPARWWPARPGRRSRGRCPG